MFSLAPSTPSSNHDAPWQSCIGEARRERGLSQRELAEAVGVSENTISSWEKAIPASFEIAFKICRFFATEIQAQFNGDEIQALRNIATLRKHHRTLGPISQRQLANAIQVTENTISTWEKEEHQTVEKLEKLCRKLGCHQLRDLYQSTPGSSTPAEQVPLPRPQPALSPSPRRRRTLNPPSQQQPSQQQSSQQQSSQQQSSQQPIVQPTAQPAATTVSKPDPFGLRRAPETLQRHALVDVIGVSLCASLGGAQHWGEVEQYGHAHQRFLQTFLPLSQGIPRADTAQRLFASLKPEVFPSHGMHWAEAIADLNQAAAARGDRAPSPSREDVADPGLAIDLRVGRSCLLLSGPESSSPLATRFVIPQWLQLLDVSGKVVLVDANACHPSLAQTIVAGGGDYIVSLKNLEDDFESQNFYQNVEALLDYAQQQRSQGASSPEMPHEFFQQMIPHPNELPEQRQYWLMSGVEADLDYVQRWEHLKAIGLIRGQRRPSGSTKPAPQQRYYLLSRGKGVMRFRDAIAAYWTSAKPDTVSEAIEARDWVLQVRFEPRAPDQSRDPSLENLSYLRRVALDLGGPLPSPEGVPTPAQDPQSHYTALSALFGRILPASC